MGDPGGAAEFCLLGSKIAWRELLKAASPEKVLVAPPFLHCSGGLDWPAWGQAGSGRLRAVALLREEVSGDREGHRSTGQS